MQSIPKVISQEFFKIKNTLAFKGSFILPLLINALVMSIFIFKADDILKEGMSNLWYRYLSFTIGIMGSLILPMFIIFLSFSINDIEHKADTWKNLFSYPIEKRNMFIGKWITTFLIFGIFMLGFLVFTYVGGNILSIINPEFGFQNHNMLGYITKLYSKMFLASIALLCLQFFFSMLWSDFMKSMGLGLLFTITSMIAMRWEYIYLIPYAQPMYSINQLFAGNNNLGISFNTKEIWVGLASSFVFIISAYSIMRKRSIR